MVAATARARAQRDQRRACPKYVGVCSLAVRGAKQGKHCSAQLRPGVAGVSAATPQCVVASCRVAASARWRMPPGRLAQRGRKRRGHGGPPCTQAPRMPANRPVLLSCRGCFVVVVVHLPPALSVPVASFRVC